MAAAERAGSHIDATSTMRTGSSQHSVLLAALLVAASQALVAPPATRRLAAGAVRVRAGKGFGEGASQPKKTRSSKGPATIRVDADVDDDGVTATMRASAPGGEQAEAEIFEQFGIDSTGRTTRTVAEPVEPAFEPLKNVPPGVQIGVEKFLLGTIVVLLVAFVGIGCAITLEAFAAAKQEPLDPALRDFIVDQLEPKFTPILGIGFACSILLGGLKTLQLTSDGGQYSEGGATYSED